MEDFVTLAEYKEAFNNAIGTRLGIALEPGIHDGSFGYIVNEKFPEWIYDEIIKNRNKNNGWISVDDRLPKDGTYLVFVPYDVESIKYGILVAYYGGKFIPR